jgi:hypothetical protein
MTDALKLWVYFGDSQLTGAELTSDALMDSLARRQVAVSALWFGALSGNIRRIGGVFYLLLRRNGADGGNP